MVPERFVGAPPQICALHHVEVRDRAVLVVSECSSECFQDAMKVRLANRASFNEEELVYMVHEVLVGLRYLEVHQNNLRSLGEDDRTCK